MVAVTGMRSASAAHTTLELRWQSAIISCVYPCSWMSAIVRFSLAVFSSSKPARYGSSSAGSYLRLVCAGAAPSTPSAAPYVA